MKRFLLTLIVLASNALTFTGTAHACDGYGSGCCRPSYHAPAYQSWPPIRCYSSNGAPRPLCMVVHPIYFQAYPGFTPLISSVATDSVPRFGQRTPLAPSAAPTTNKTGINPPITASAAPPQYGGQKTCPVLGEDLGSMGPPIPVTVKGMTLYVCCEGCVAKVQKTPDTYIAKVLAERGSR